MLVYRVFFHDPGARPGDPGHALHLHRPQGAGRWDNPDLYDAWYFARSPEGAIGEVFGIQDLNLGTAGVGDSSKVQVSGNIGKRLQVKYGIGLFDGLAEVTLRYRLLPQLYFQSVSGTNQVFDLLYQFEF